MLRLVNNPGGAGRGERREGAMLLGSGGAWVRIGASATLSGWVELMSGRGWVHASHGRDSALGRTRAFPFTASAKSKGAETAMPHA